MCMSYAGVEYHYGIRAALSSDVGLGSIDILMTNHLTDRPYVYSGLCLNNGLYVNTEHREKYTAIGDIIKKAVDGSIGAEKAYAQLYPGQPYQPLISIIKEDPDLYRSYCKRMRNALSFGQYNAIRRQLTPLRERRKAKSFQSKCVAALIFISILPRCIPIISDYKEIYLASNITKTDPRLNNDMINYRRV